MRDIKSIRGDMFAHGVPFELVQELEAAARDDPDQAPSDKPYAKMSDEDNEQLCIAIDKTIVYNRLFDCWHIDRTKFAALRAKLAVLTAGNTLGIDEAFARAWPLLKQEYVWRHEDDCGGDEIEEGLDMLMGRLRLALLASDNKEN